jgi:hypothetical protein
MPTVGVAIVEWIGGAAAVGGAAAAVEGAAAGAAAGSAAAGTAAAGTAAAGAATGLTLAEAITYAGAASNILSAASALGSKPGRAPESTPAVTPPTAFPSRDQQAARRASVAEQLLRRGRASTILSDTGSDKLGAG